MKKRLLNIFLTLLLTTALLTTGAMAADGSFNAKLAIERGGNVITVTVQDSAVLASRQPTLTIPCDFAYAQVSFGGSIVASVLQDGMISFRVAAGGIYTVTKTNAPADPAPAPAPVPSPKPDNGPEQEAEEPFVNPYPDVQAGDWYSGAVQFVTEEKLMTGTGKGFEPNAATTRAMLWTILARMDGADTSSTGAWYAAAQDWAVKHGVSDGTSPDGKITREQLATMLYRYAQSRGLVKADVQGDLSAFADSASVSPYAVEAMRWAVGAGIVNGMDGKLNPQGEATRAQMATMLMRYAKLAA